MTEDVFLYVRRHPGATCAELAEAFHVGVPIMGATLRVLRDEKRLTSRGNTRGTRYYPRKRAAR